jgi:hypothetical protein
VSFLQSHRSLGERLRLLREVFLAFLLSVAVSSHAFGIEGTFVGERVEHTVQGALRVTFPAIPTWFASPFFFADLVLVPEPGPAGAFAGMTLGWNGAAPDDRALLEQLTYWRQGELRVAVGAVSWRRRAFGPFLVWAQRETGRLVLTVAGAPTPIRQARLEFRRLALPDFVPPFVTVRAEVPVQAGNVVRGDGVRVRLTAWPGAVSYRCRLDGGAWVRCDDGWEPGTLSPGWHRVDARGWNSVGLSGVVSTRWVYVEPTVAPPAPTIRILGVEPSTPLHNALQVRVAFRRNGLAPTNEGLCQLDDGPVAPCVSPVSVSDFGDGRHVFRVRATPSAAAASVEWTTDRTPPIVQFVSAPPELIAVDEAFFEVSANEPATFQCALDDGALEPCEPAAIAYGKLGDGVHRLQVVATDRAGNASEPVEYRWIVDTTPPEAPALLAEPAGAVVATRDIVLLITGSEPNLRFECRLDDEEWRPCESPWRRFGLSAGSHVAQVRAYDLLGWVGPTAEYRWTIDLTPPALRLTRLAPTSSPTRETEAVFQLDSDGAAVQCLLDGEPAPECGPRVRFQVGEGAHRFEARALGDGGLVGEWQVSEWVVDRTPPILRVDFGGIGALTNATVLTVTFDAGDAVRVTCVLDGIVSDCVSPFVANNLADGPHTFLLSAVDAAGNESSESKRWTVDTRVPIVRIDNVTPGWTPTQSRTLRLVFSVDDPTASTECRFDAGAWLSCESPWTIDGVADGDHTAAVRAIDPAGNLSLPVTHAWTVAAPFPISSVTVIPLSQTSVRVSWRTSVPAAREVRYGTGSLAGGYVLSASVSEATPLSTVHTMTLTGLLPDTTYVAQPRSRSGAGEVSIADPVEFRTPRP